MPVDAVILQQIADAYASAVALVLPRSLSNTELLQIIAAATTGRVQRSLSDTALLQAISAGLVANPPGGGNATVPNDAMIQPPQAYVDNIEQFTVINGDLDLSNKGITRFLGNVGGSPYVNYLGNQHDNGNSPTLNFTGNAIPTGDINGIVQVIFDNGNIIAGFDLSGGTNGIPTNGAANPQLWTIGLTLTNGNTAKWNIRGGTIAIGGGNSAGTTNGSLTQAEVDALLDFLNFNYSGQSFNIDIGTGTIATPTDILSDAVIVLSQNMVLVFLVHGVRVTVQSDSYTLENCHITQAEMDVILAQLRANFGTSLPGAQISLIGNDTPTAVPASLRFDLTLVIDSSVLADVDCYFDTLASHDVSAMDVLFDGTSPLSASFVASPGGPLQIVIGTSDTPTAANIAAKMRDLFNTISGVTATGSGVIVNVSDVNSNARAPYGSFTANGTLIAGTVLTRGGNEDYNFLKYDNGVTIAVDGLN